MPSILVASLVLGLVAAAPNPNPIPQGFDFGVVDSAPEPTALGPPADKTIDAITYDRTSAVAAASSQVLATAVPSAKVKRTDDAPVCPTEEQPAGSGVLTRNPDTAAAFRDNQAYSVAANSAPAPAGYSKAFTDLKASIEQIGYLGLRTVDSYDPALCAEHCDPEHGCVAFNLYFERDPSFDTDPNSCPNPPSTTNVKCTLYGFPVASGGATNKGQWRDGFAVAIAGSNGYNRKPLTSPDIDKYDGPTELQCAINAPLDPDTGKNTHVGSTAFKTTFDPSQCAAACNTHNNYHLSHRNPADGTYPPCNFFNSYVLYKNGVPESLVCSMYSRAWDESYAVNCGQWRGHDEYTVGQSASYALQDRLPGACEAPKTWDGTACVEGAAPPGANPGCKGATCRTFKQCSSDTDCVCVTSAEGPGYCVPGSTPCANPSCETSADCGTGMVCAVDTCCGRPVCAPVANVCENPMRKLMRMARGLAVRAEEGEDTLAGAWDEDAGSVVPHLEADA
ncbi:hypothetical protein D0862_07397 [Hortaea werneckii]|uniref:Apple domain-containing protein n=1 Tax=Hortaea werneckii TaxID=91943 RepID=A0A3M7GCG1_HORWE|nr:hypothetical protein KC320_g4440 [Hortaea werneckii]RMY98845.1 hypothetical protein D0862_07397 [Hortaea werneckii]